MAQSTTENTKAATAAVPKKRWKKRTWRILFFLILIVLISNPGMIPILPTGAKVALLKALNKLFGDVSEITGVILINPVTVAQLVIMALGMTMLCDIVNVFLSNRNPKDRHRKTLLSLYLSLSGYLFALAGIIWGLSIVGISPGMIFAGVSVVAMVISFGVENLIADIVTGVLMVFEKECSVDDIIEVDGYRGMVKEVRLRTTLIEDRGGNVRHVNNSGMRNIINRSVADSKAVCDVEITDASSLEKAEAAVSEAVEQMKRASQIKNVTYKGVQKLGKDNYTIRVEADTSEKYVFNAQRYMNRQLLMAFQKDGIKGPQSGQQKGK